MAEFETLISRNKRNSVLLIMGFILFISGLAMLIGWAVTGTPQAAIPSLIIAFVVATIFGLVGYYGGSSMVLGMSGAKQIQKRDDPQLFNVVEELTIAAGMPMPKVYLINDTAMNAFATGRDPAHASIAVTVGLRTRLKRDELQGVIAHELSHVKNLDIRLMMLVVVLVGMVVLLCDFFLRFTFWGGGRRRGKGGDARIQLLIFVIAILFAIVAPFFAKLIQLAISRQREYLADASAARMTRYPEGLASALAKLGGDKELLEVANRATSHLYIVKPLTRRREKAEPRWFATHPPIRERIRRLRAIGTSEL
ncbi:MAG: M48 family metallopeptidase [Planctomycetia bacterium]|nr:M48 family metallopeptidase [Planctomycetia bacterium]